MQPRKPKPLSDLVRSLLIRYATLTPDGIVLENRSPPVADTSATLLRVGPARTLYRERRPDCRSLDGLRSLKGRECASCPDRTACTPQLLVDLDIDGQPYRLLLSFTSAKNFLVAADRLRRTDGTLEGVRVRLRVLNRGRWGELRIDPAAADPI